MPSRRASATAKPHQHKREHSIAATNTHATRNSRHNDSLSERPAVRARAHRAVPKNCSEHAMSTNHAWIAETVLTRRYQSAVSRGNVGTAVSRTCNSAAARLGSMTASSAACAAPTASWEALRSCIHGIQFEAHRSRGACGDGQRGAMVLVAWCMGVHRTLLLSLPRQARHRRTAILSVAGHVGSRPLRQTS